MSRDELDALADEYVLGLTDAGEQAAIERRLAGEADLRAAVARSRERFLPLDLTAPRVTASETLWSGVAARLRAGEVVGGLAAGGAPLPANLPHAPRGFMRRHLGTALAAGIGLMIGAGVSLTALQPEPIVLTVLVDASGAPLAVVEDFGGAAARVRFVADVAVPEGRQMQVWTLPSPETGPVSLGLLEGPAGQVLRGPDLPRPAAGQLYEITLEQLGGSPTGRPTGPIVAKGFAAAQEDI